MEHVQELTGTRRLRPGDDPAVGGRPDIGRLRRAAAHTVAAPVDARHRADQWRGRGPQLARLSSTADSKAAPPLNTTWADCPRTARADRSSRHIWRCPVCNGERLNYFGEPYAR